MKEHDVDTIRLRLWNDPKSEDGEAGIVKWPMSVIRIKSADRDKPVSYTHLDVYKRQTLHLE